MSSIMTVEKPEIQRTYLQAVDARTGKSRSITVYNATPDEVIESAKRIFTSADREARRPRRKVPA